MIRQRLELETMDIRREVGSIGRLMSFPLQATRSLLANPIVFDFVQYLLGVREVREYFVNQYVKPFSGARVLDIGCGTGELLSYLEGCEYFGFDYDKRYVDRAQECFGNLGHFEQGDVSEIRVEERAYDLVIASGVIHHLDDRQAQALFLLASHALKPGGRLCSFDMCDRAAGFFQNFMNRVDRGKHIRKETEYGQLAREMFSDVQLFDYCGRLFIPVSHCVMVCTRSV